MEHRTAASPGDTQALEPDLARAVVEDSIRRYVASRRPLAGEFSRRNFGLRGSLGLHRLAFGGDLLRAPINVLLVAPALLSMISAAGLGRLGARRAARWLEARQWFLETDVGREISWRVHTEFLGLPITQGARVYARDALLEEILRDPRVAVPLADALAGAAERARAPAVRARLQQALAAYSGSRAAAAELTNALLLAGTGALSVQQLTPSALSFGPALAAAAAQHAAVAGFPLGAGLGKLWYGLFPARPSALLVAGSSVGLLLLMAVFAAFSGVVADPLQHRLGLHRRRLERLLDTLERNLLGDASARFSPRDHYAARLVDLFEVLRVLSRHLR